MPCIDPQKLTLFAYHLIRLPAPSPSRGRLMPPFVFFVSPHPPPGTFPTQGGRLMPPFVLFVSPSSASRHLPHQGEGICRRGGHCPSAKNRCGRPMVVLTGCNKQRHCSQLRLCGTSGSTSPAYVGSIVGTGIARPLRRLTLPVRSFMLIPKEREDMGS